MLHGGSGRSGVEHGRRIGAVVKREPVDGQRHACSRQDPGQKRQRNAVAQGEGEAFTRWPHIRIIGPDWTIRYPIAPRPREPTFNPEVRGLPRPTFNPNVRGFAAADFQPSRERVSFGAWAPWSNTQPTKASPF